jgi:DNA-binding PadR family transcriptional regulator
MPTRKPPAPVPLEPHWFQILLALADRDLHGLAIMTDVLERTGGRMRLWPGMLYRALGRLADMNLVVEIEPPEGAAAAGGRPRFFRLTPAGRRACAAEAERLAGFVEVARRKKLLKA